MNDIIIMVSLKHNFKTLATFIFELKYDVNLWKLYINNRWQPCNFCYYFYIVADTCLYPVANSKVIFYCFSKAFVHCALWFILQKEWRKEYNTNKRTMNFNENAIENLQKFSSEFLNETSENLIMFFLKKAPSKDWKLQRFSLFKF